MGVIMNIGKLLQMPIETLFVAFFNATDGQDGNFEIQSRYRVTKFLPLPADSHEKTAQALTHKYGIDFVQTNATTIAATVINDKHISLDDFLNAVYEKIIVLLNKLPANYPLDEEIALAMFLLRGSADFNRSLYALDLKNPTPRYVDNIFKILLSSNNLIERLNLNFRELQPQFATGERERNTQIRINLKWFYDNVIVRYPNINKYKTDVLKINKRNLGELHAFHMFEERLIFYREKILGRELSKNEINALRQDLEFREPIEVVPENKFSLRNQKIVAFARETFADVCVGCGDQYDIKDRSFLMPRNNRYYFEVNHVIAYANDSDAVDVLDNLVKLCPVCHRALTPHRAFPDLQRHIIENMLKSRPEVGKFVSSMMPANYRSPVDYVFDSLK